MKVAVVIPTCGRAGIVAGLLDRLALQSRLPDQVFVIGAAPSDVAGLQPSLDRLSGVGVNARAELAAKGSCSQRNHALDALGRQSDLLALIDDDYIPAADFIDQARSYFEANPDVVGANGALLADGARTGPMTLEDADARLAEPAAISFDELPREALYGCNMILRAAAVGDLRFDENLPLYGWQEDIDFTMRLGARGRLTLTSRIRGVHLGVKSGKSPGAQLGYSQIANPLYLLNKGTIPRKLALKLLVKNPVANLVKLTRPEPNIDRRGRLRGNLLAVADLLRGRLHPTRILELT